MKTAQFGTVSHGTLRTEDLIEAFTDALESLASGNTHSKLIGEAQAWLDIDADSLTDDALDDHEEDGSAIVEELQDALQEFAPAYAYFGAHPGDGSDFGFWLGGLEDFDGLRVSDTSEVPDDYSGEVLHVNDHGNATLYAAQGGELTEVWALV